MGFWIFMTSVSVIVPIVMIVFGRLFKLRPPKEINHIYGYRSTRSMKNDKTWKFAHDYCGKLWFKSGWIVLVATIIKMLTLLGAGTETIGKTSGFLMMIQFGVMIGTIVLVEVALNRKFDKDKNILDKE